MRKTAAKWRTRLSTWEMSAITRIAVGNHVSNNPREWALNNNWKRLVFSAVFAISAGPTMAQDSDWDFAATIYLFTAETNVASGGFEGSLSFKDALANLDMAFMGAFAASNGRWGFIADYLMTDISFGNSTPGPAFSGLNTALKTRIFNGYATYRIHQDQKTSVDLAAGFRWFDTRTDLTLLPGTSPGGTTRIDESWVDPVVGVKAHFEMSEKWSGTVFADYGGFSRDSETWQVLLTADYEINEKWVARIGYRHLSVDHDINGSDFSFDQSGPVFGISYRF